jgi:Arc/MetJ-type ribon-helix-helix transcriptional regulator
MNRTDEHDGAEIALQQSLERAQGMTYHHTRRCIMGRSKIAITIDEETLGAIDRLVSDHLFPNRSQAIQEALDEKLCRLTHSRLAQECAKLDPGLEQALAEEGMGGELAEWPEY